MSEKAGTLCGTNICKSYGKNEVLKDLNITIKKGCIYGLIGRNGVGKTTLLGILTGQKRMNQGEVLYDGMKVWDNRKVLSHMCFSRELGIVDMNNTQNGMRVKEYLKLASYYFRNWNKEYEEFLVEKFNIDTKKVIMKLSKGQMSMVTIIVALASGAEITFLDEPVAGLDVIAREDFYALLLEEYSKSKRTFVISTHIIEEASSIFERVLIMEDGKIIEDSDTESLVDQFRFISGSEEELEQVLSNVVGLQVLNTQSLGKHRMVTIRGTQEVFEQLLDLGVELESMNLQNVFVALCGHKEVK